MSPRHDAIAGWLIANPQMALGECAKAFGVTPSWLSCIIHSDVFRAYYRKLLGEHEDTRILPMRDKLMGIAHQALDNLAEQVAVGGKVDPQFSLDVADKMLGRLGYGSKAAAPPPSGTTNITVVGSVTPDELARARETYRAFQQSLREPLAVTGPDSPPVRDDVPPSDQ